MRKLLFFINYILFTVSQFFPFIYLYWVITEYSYGFDVSCSLFDRVIILIAITLLWMVFSVLIVAVIHGGKNHE